MASHLTMEIFDPQTHNYDRINYINNIISTQGCLRVYASSMFEHLMHTMVSHTGQVQNRHCMSKHYCSQCFIDVYCVYYIYTSWARISAALFNGFFGCSIIKSLAVLPSLFLRDASAPTVSKALTALARPYPAAK